MKKVSILIMMALAATLLAGTQSCQKEEQTTPKNPSWNVQDSKALPELPKEVDLTGSVTVTDAVTYVASLSASTEVKDVALKGTCSESEIKELALSISKGKASINLDLSNCEPEAINFQGCANLKEVTLPDNVQMPERAFAECPDLEIVNIGDAKAQSKRLSKYSTDEFVDDVKDVVEDVADFIGECAEALWDWITSADVKNDVSPRTYENCKMLRIVNVVSNNCKVIGEDAFKGCYNLETVNLGNVFIIDKRAFEGCTALASITIPASVSRMAESAFINCPKLKNVKFEDPNLWARTQSEAKWREYKFDQTYDITKHDFSNAGYYDASNPNVGDQYSWYFVHRKKVTNITAANVGRCYEGRYVFVFEKGYTISKFDELAAALKQRPDIKADVVINSHSQLDSYFSGWDGLYSVSSTVADRIGRSAFSGCANLASVAAKNVIKVGPYAFYGCPENIRITLGDHNNSGAWHITENQAEWDAKSGGDVYQGEPQWTKIIKYMYYNQGESDVPEYTVDYGEAAGFIRNLESNRTYRLVITGNYVRSMDIRNALDARGDDNVNVYLDFSKVKGMTEVWINFMSGVKNLYECRLPESVTIIEASAFLNCKNLRDFQMPSNLVKIGRCSFMGCGFTQSITLPSSLVDIEQGAFVNAFGGDAKPVLSSTDWYARNVTTGVETEYSKWKNTRWWDEQANYFYTSKSSRYGEPAAGDTDTNLGLVAYYPFDKDANDHSGNGNNGSINNLTLVSGKRGNAYKFEGVDNPGWIQIPNSPSLQFDEAASFSMWFYVNSWRGQDGYASNVAYGSQKLFSKDYDRGEIYGQVCGINENKWHVGFWGICYNRDDCGVDFEGNILKTWNHVVFIATKSYLKVYLNGKLIDRKDYESDFSASNREDLYIGRLNSSYSYYFNGIIDEFRVYNRELNSAEVSALYKESN